MREDPDVSDFWQRFDDKDGEVDTEERNSIMLRGGELILMQQILWMLMLLLPIWTSTMEALSLYAVFQWKFHATSASPAVLTQSNDRATDVNKTPLSMLMIMAHILKTGKVYEALFSSKPNVPNLLNICAGSEQAATVALKKSKKNKNKNKKK